MCKKDDLFKELDEWLEQFLDDPFTSMMDEYSFHVELFETCDSYIIEADLPGYCPNQLAITLFENAILIQAKSKENPPEKPSILERTITLPLFLDDKIIYAMYDKDVLEITIKKNGKTTRDSKEITISRPSSK